MILLLLKRILDRCGNIDTVSRRYCLVGFMWHRRLHPKLISSNRGQDSAISDKAFLRKNTVDGGDKVFNEVNCRRRSSPRRSSMFLMRIEMDLSPFWWSKVVQSCGYRVNANQALQTKPALWTMSYRGSISNTRMITSDGIATLDKETCWSFPSASQLDATIFVRCWSSALTQSKALHRTCACWLCNVAPSGNQPSIVDAIKRGSSSRDSGSCGLSSSSFISDKSVRFRLLMTLTYRQQQDQGTLQLEKYSLRITDSISFGIVEQQNSCGCNENRMFFDS